MSRCTGSPATQLRTSQARGYRPAPQPGRQHRAMDAKSQDAIRQLRSGSADEAAFLVEVAVGQEVGQR